MKAEVVCDHECGWAPRGRTQGRTRTCGREDLVPQGHVGPSKVLLIGAESQAEEVCWTGEDDGRK